MNCGDPERKIGILFIDMDGLKQINTKKGHKGGDRAIRQISTLILKNIRERDIAVRYGGNEFLIVVEELSGRESSAYGLAKRLIEIINEKENSYLTTISIGVHITKVGNILKGNDTSVFLKRKWDKEVAKADKMTSKARKEGKNTIIFSQKDL
jgi:diguanylate cyclase (GGDEF)-like protein